MRAHSARWPDARHALVDRDCRWRPLHLTVRQQPDLRRTWLAAPWRQVSCLIPLQRSFACRAWAAAQSPPHWHSCCWCSDAQRHNAGLIAGRRRPCAPAPAGRGAQRSSAPAVPARAAGELCFVSRGQIAGEFYGVCTDNCPRAAPGTSKAPRAAALGGDLQCQRAQATAQPGPARMAGGRALRGHRGSRIPGQLCSKGADWLADLRTDAARYRAHWQQFYCGDVHQLATPCRVLDIGAEGEGGENTKPGVDCGPCRARRTQAFRH